MSLVHANGPTRDALFELAAGRMHPEAAAWLEEHIRGCDECGTVLARITATRLALEPPAEQPFVRQRHLTEVRHRLAERRKGRLRLLIPAAALAAAAVVVVLARRPQPPQVAQKATPEATCRVLARAGETRVAAQALAAGSVIDAGQRISLAAHARVVARWGEAMAVFEGGEAGASLTIEPAGRDQRLLRLEQGRVLLDVDPLPAGMTLAVVTDDARVTVHGTRFLVDRGAGATQVAVDRGLVRVASRSGATVDVPAGSRLAARGLEPISAEEASSLDRIGRPTAERTTGTLEVLADVPGAEVSVDDEPVGAVPISISSAPGTHKLRVSAPGRLPIEQTVEVAADVTTTVRAELRSILEEETATPKPGRTDLLAQARSLVFSGAYDRALAVLQRLRHTRPSAAVLARAALLEAQIDRLRRRPDLALELFERVGRGSGHEAEQARYLLAQTLQRDLSDPKRAAAAWAGALHRFPRGMFHEEELYRLGESLVAAEQTHEGLAMLGRYVRDFASGSHVEDAHLLMAQMERDRLANCDAAVPHFRAVATAGGRRAAQASIAEARCLRSLGRLPEARAAYLRYLSQAPRGRFAEEARAQAQVRRTDRGAD